MGAEIGRDALKGSLTDESDDPFRGDSEEDGESEGTDDRDRRDQESEGPSAMDIDAEVDEDEEIDSDEAFGEGDEQRFQSFTFKGNQEAKNMNNKRVADGQKSNGETLNYVEDRSNKLDDRSGGNDGSDRDANSSDHGMNNGRGNSNDDDTELDSDLDNDIDDEASDLVSNTEITSSLHPRAASFDRAAIRAIMASEQKSAIENITAATKADVSKGAAVKQQRASFDTLLNTRIRLQKALIVTNSLSANGDVPTILSDSDRAAIEAAEAAALSLFDMLTALRESLPFVITGVNTGTSKKRPLSATLSTSTPDIHGSLLDQEQDYVHVRRAILDRWARKTHAASSLLSINKFSQTATQPLSSVLDMQLSSSNIDRLVKRTQAPRSCAPLQASKGSEDSLIYDDADWYALLLRDLIDTKLSSTSVPTNILPRAATSSNSAVVDNVTALAGFRREAKTYRRDVDTKASKGRKMRYTVHEKLQNFMAPQDLGVWGERQMDELFGSLLGKRIRGGLGEGTGSRSGSEEPEADGLVNGLKLFAEAR